jgi:hypothetical protein
VNLYLLGSLYLLIILFTIELIKIFIILEIELDIKYFTFIKFNYREILSYVIFY